MTSTCTLLCTVNSSVLSSLFHNKPKILATMGDSDDNKQAPLVPSWQQAAPTQPDNIASPESTLDQARRFLQEEAVKDSSREKKVEFLKSKGLEESDITELLEESADTETSSSTTTTTPAAAPQPVPSPSSTTIEAASSPPFETSTQPDRPPIVTYPEFLTKPLKAPPLITAAGLLNSLTAIAAASTLVYGATKHLVSPMVTSLTQARVDLHATANTNLTALVDKLERAVSELPAGYHHLHTTNNTHPHGKKPLLLAPGAAADDASSAASSTYDDPSELFHRDVGVQTSAPPSPLPSYGYNKSLLDPSPTSTPTTNPTAHQASRLAQLASTVRVLALDQIHVTESLEATKGELDALSSDLHKLTYPVESFGGGASSYLYGTANKNEPDDEIRRVKTSIRGVKGMLLSTRSFPATTA